MFNEQNHGKILNFKIQKCMEISLFTLQVKIIKCIRRHFEKTASNIFDFTYNLSIGENCMKFQSLIAEK